MRGLCWRAQEDSCARSLTDAATVVAVGASASLEDGLTAEEQSRRLPGAAVLWLADAAPLVAVYKDGAASEGYSLDVRARQEGTDGIFRVHVSVEVPFGGGVTAVVGDGTCMREALDWLLQAAARHPARVELDAQRARAVWGHVVDGYEATVEYGPYGATGDPRRTVLAALGAPGTDWEGAPTFAEVREALAIIAMVKGHDGRISRINREWLARGQSSAALDWYLEWGVKMRRLDDIHPAHVDGIVSAMRQWRA